MIHFYFLDFNVCRSEEVISLFWNAWNMNKSLSKIPWDTQFVRIRQLTVMYMLYKDHGQSYL